MKKKIRIGLAIAIALVWAILVAGRILDSIQAHRCRSAEAGAEQLKAHYDRLTEQWLEKEASIRKGMTSDEVISILGKPNETYKDTDGEVWLGFRITQERRRDGFVKGLIPHALDVRLKDGVVSDTYLSYR